jgi:polyisoprenoid-binding protein YceI
MDAPSDRELWSIDPECSSLTFNLRHALLGRIRGELECWGGRVLVDPGHPTHFSVHVWADLSSLDTGSRRRNDAILDTELFDIRWEPALVFDTDQVEVADGGCAVVLGWLGVGSYKRRVAVSIEAGFALASDSGTPRIIAKARAAIDRHEFGLHRQKRPWDWLSEQFVDRQIEIAAHLELMPSSHAGAVLAGLRSRDTLSPYLSRIPATSFAAWGPLSSARKALPRSLTSQPPVQRAREGNGPLTETFGKIIQDSATPAGAEAI